MSSDIDNISGFAKSVGLRLLNKNIEIYQGSQHDTVRRAEIETTRKTVILGKLIDVLDECLVVEINDEGLVTEAYVNTYNIHSVVEIKDKMSIFDIYLPDERKK